MKFLKSRSIIFFFGFILFFLGCSCNDLLFDQAMKDIDIQISEVSVKKINVKNTSLEVVFMLDNKSKRTYQIKTLDVNIYKTSSYENLLGRSEIKDIFIVHADTLNQFTSQVEINNFKMGPSLFSNTMSEKNSFFIIVNAQVEYKNIELPIIIKRRMDYNPVTLEFELK